MASSFEDMFSNQPYRSYNNGKKSGKKGIILLLIMLLLVGVVVLMFLATKMQPKKEVTSNKTAFLTYLGQENINEKINLQVLKELLNKIAANSNESKTEITVSSNLEEIKELENYKIIVDTKYDKNNSRGLADMKFEYLDNAIIDLQALITGKSMAIKSDEIVTRYVGYKYSGLVDTLTSQEESVIDVSISEVDFDVLSNINFSEEFLVNEIQRYLQVVNNNLTEDKFSQKAVTLDRANGAVETIEYTLTLNETEQFALLSKILEELKNDDELISICKNVLLAFGTDLNEEMIKLAIDSLINSTYEVETDPSRIYTYSIYVSNSQIVKLVISSPETNFDVDYINNSNESSTVFSILDANKANGVTIELNRISKDISEKAEILVSIISEKSVTTKVSLQLLFEGITSPNTLNLQTIFSYTNTTNEINVNLDTEFEFKNVEVEDLTTDNCLFLDELNAEERDIVIASIETRTQEILTEKAKQIGLIKTNTGSSVIEQDPSTEEEHVDEKSVVQEKIINAVANEMHLAQQNGEEYTIYNLETLEIEGYEIEVTLAEDVATIIVDGYVFTVNSSFVVESID